MKKKTLQKISRLFASLVLVGAMSLGTVATVNAAGATIWREDQTPTAAFTVEYKRATGVEVPKIDFQVTFTKTGFKQSDADSTMNTTEPVKSKMPSITTTTVSFEKNDTKQKKESTNFLGNFLSDLSTTNNGAGIYYYTVSQNTPTFQKNNDQDELIVSDAKYLVKVYVAQKSDGSGLYIKGLVVINGTTDSTTPGDKVDATPGGPTGSGSTSNMVFTNEYIAKNGTGGGDENKPKPDDPKTYGLKVEKAVAGNGASATKDFSYTMKITAPADITTTDTQYTYYKVSADGATVTLGGKGTYGTDATFTLKAKESILVKSCYAGSKLEITEKGAANWTPQVDVTLGGSAYQQKTGGMGIDLAFTSTEDHPIGQNNNIVKYTNTFLDNPVTGIIVNNFPFVMMIVMAMAAFVAIVAVKSRRRMNER